MKIAIGNDHSAVELKNIIVDFLKEKGIEVLNLGTDSSESCDYPVYGEKVGRAVVSGEADLGIAICGTGLGISLAANKVKGVRACVCSEPYTAVMSRRHPLAGEKRLEKARLATYAEVALASELPPVQPEMQMTQQPRRRMRVWDQATRLELLSRSQTAYMWSPPMPGDLLDRYGLTQLPVEDMPEYQDALIYPRGYHMSRWEQAFYDLARREAQQTQQE